MDPLVALMSKAKAGLGMEDEEPDEDKDEPGKALLARHASYSLPSECESELQYQDIAAVKRAAQPDAGYIIAANNMFICYSIKGGNIRGISVSNGQKCLLKGHVGNVVDMILSPVPNARLLCSVGADGKAVVWKLGQPAELEDGSLPDLPAEKMAEFETGYMRARWSSSGRLALVKESAIEVWDNFRTPTTTLSAPEMGAIRDCCWSPDGKRVLTAGGDGNVCAWDVAASECSATWRASDGMLHIPLASCGHLKLNDPNDITPTLNLLCFACPSRPCGSRLLAHQSLDGYGLATPHPHRRPRPNRAQGLNYVHVFPFIRLLY
jgi:WD40 repeat protein